MAWQDDYYRGSSDYPITGSQPDDFDPETDEAPGTARDEDAE